MDIAEVRNTWSRPQDPGTAEKYAELDEPIAGRNGCSLLPVFSGTAFGSAVNYPLIVESWSKKQSGRQKRRWQAEFTPAERRTLQKYYGKFYDWYLRTGTPRRVSLRLGTLQLLLRAVAFFAET